MDPDLTDLLRSWPHDPGQLNIRLIRAADGEEKIQMRVDLGILQMEVTGRPDGLWPDGYQSMLERCEARLDEHVAEHGSVDDFSISREECRLLREEAAQYYHRYVSMFVLGDYQGVVRDTSRNVRCLDLMRLLAEHEEDRSLLEQFRPYVSMMRTRAIASQAAADNEGAAALLSLEEGIATIAAMYEEWGRSAAEAEASSEIRLLRGMRDELVKKLPASLKTELRERLKQALQSENYELAAILRDELKMMRD